MNIGKRLGHESPEIKRNFVVPDTYDTIGITKGYQALSHVKQERTLVAMDKSPTRDNILYKFDEEYVKEMKREQRLKSFGIADYLPNSLRRKSDYTSNLDGLSRNISKSRFEKSTFCDTITLPKMRKGSISELGSNFGVTANPSMS